MAICRIEQTKYPSIRHQRRAHGGMESFANRYLHRGVAFPEVLGIVERTDRSILISYPPAKSLPRPYAQTLEAARANAEMAHEPEVVGIVVRHGQITRRGSQQV